VIRAAARPAALALVLGVVASLNFDPLDLPGTMVVALAGLMWLARTLAAAPARVIALVGLAFGAGFMVPLIWWMNAVSAGAYVGLVVAETLFFIPIMLGLRAAMRLSWWPLAAAGVWTAGEWARGSFPFNGFPWGRLAHTAVDTPFASYVRALGMPGLSAVLMLAAATLLALVTARTFVARAVAVAALSSLVLGGALLPTGLAADRQKRPETRTVALVQGDVPGVFRTWPEGAIFKLHREETERLATQVESGVVPSPDMVLWPENATSTDPFVEPWAAQAIESLSLRIGAPILVGGLFNGPTSSTIYNQGVVWDHNGPGQRYVKLRPVPFGEYIPWREKAGSLFGVLAREIPKDMVAGDSSGALTIANTVIGDTICYDIAYDDVVRWGINDGAQMIVVQTSNAAFTDTSQPEQQWKISRLRAIETGRWVAVPSTNGISGVVNPHGQVVERAPMHQPATIIQPVELATKRTLATFAGQYIEWPLIVVGVSAWVAGFRRRKDPASHEGAHHCADVQRGRQP
jgi:apolipoprotein N-acyltransferase